MTIKSVQTIIKIGSSAGVTLPAKDLKHAGLSVGDDVIITVNTTGAQDVDEHTSEVVELTQQLIARHKKALKSLSKR